MVPEDLLFWIAPLSGSPSPGQAVLCRRHADAMSVPRGWTIDDRREATPRLFRPRPSPAAQPAPSAVSASRRRSARPAPVGEQLQIDGTGETPRPSAAELAGETDLEAPSRTDVDVQTDDLAAPWEPSFDHDNDLDGLLEVSSPLLARAFRGTDRPRS